MYLKYLVPVIYTCAFVLLNKLLSMHLSEKEHTLNNNLNSYVVKEMKISRTAIWSVSRSSAIIMNAICDMAIYPNVIDCHTVLFTVEHFKNSTARYIRNSCS